MGNFPQKIFTAENCWKKNWAKRAMVKIEQVLSSIQVICLTYACHKDHAQPKVRKKTNGPSLAEYEF